MLKTFLKLQWNITERCNLQCRHCYRDNLYLKNELPLSQLFKILDQYIYFLRFYNIKGYIALSGGEPFLRKDFFNLLEKISQYKNLLKFGILTNGLFITKENAQRLRNLGVDFIQLSLDGMEKTNDSIRGKGTFKKIVRAAEILVKSKVPVGISFTAFKLNYKEFPEVVELGKKIGVDIVWTDRLVPWGRGKKIKSLMLDPLQLKKYYQSVVLLSRNLERTKSKTRIPINRPLFFLAERNSEPHFCLAGKTLINIMPNGDVFPCRRMPIKVGNVTEKNLIEIWNNSSFFKKLRNPPTNKICSKCKYFEQCQGGERCISWAYFGNPFLPDPQCWKAFKQLSSLKS